MKQPVTISIALLSGLAGGIAGAWVFQSWSSKHPEQLIRARSFELVDDAGHAISYWGISDGNEAVLAFGSRGLPGENGRLDSIPSGLSSRKNQLVSIGLEGGDDSPMLSMRGRDLKTRVRLYLSYYGKPFLLLEDETGPRLGLGHEQSDTPGPEDNDWSLRFIPDLTRIGVYSRKEGGRRYVHGGVWSSKERVEYPAVHPK